MKEMWASKDVQVEESKEKPKEKGSEEKDASYLETIDNRLYFYSEIYRDKILQLNKSIRELNGTLAVKKEKFSILIEVLDNYQGKM